MSPRGRGNWAQGIPLLTRRKLFKYKFAINECVC